MSLCITYRVQAKPSPLSMYHCRGWEDTTHKFFKQLLGLADGRVLCCVQLAAKCETRQALFNFQAITEASDAIIMSRGNLGLDVLPEKMALAQKAVISNCNLLGKPVLITRVVDTMVSAPRPTRCACVFSPCGYEAAPTAWTHCHACALSGPLGLMNVPLPISERWTWRITMDVAKIGLLCRSHQSNAALRNSHSRA